MMHPYSMGDDNVRIGADDGAIHIAHKHVAAKKRANLCPPKYLILSRQFDRNCGRDGDDI
jgi:hypothetical protein